MAYTLSEGRSGKLAEPRTDCPIRVLLAEDDTEMRKFLAWSLDHAGFDVIECQNGLTLVKKIAPPAEKEGDFDVIISDIRMPGLSGLQALEAAMASGGCPPMILISAFADEEARRQAEDLGAAALLAKPFNVEELIELVRDVLPFEHRQRAEGHEAPEVALPFPLEMSFRHHNGSEPVRDFVRRRAQKLSRSGERIQQCQVVVDQLNREQRRRNRYRVSIVISVPGDTIVVEHEETEGRNEGSIYLALQIAFGVALRKLRERQSQRSSRGGSKTRNSPLSS